MNVQLLFICYLNICLGLLFKALSETWAAQKSHTNILIYEWTTRDSQNQLSVYLNPSQTMAPFHRPYQTHSTRKHLYLLSQVFLDQAIFSE